MDVQAAAESERMIRRIIALLVSLAAVAERAGTRSWPVRCFVLFILRFAETVVADYVLDVTGAPAPAIDATAAIGSGHTEATRLAARFRALAAALRVLLPDTCGPMGRSVRVGSAFQLLAASVDRLAVILGGWMPKPYDTS